MMQVLTAIGMEQFRADPQRAIWFANEIRSEFLNQRKASL
jgi:hypothetical protein